MADLEMRQTIDTQVADDDVVVYTEGTLTWTRDRDGASQRECLIESDVSIVEPIES